MLDVIKTAREVVAATIMKVDRINGVDVFQCRSCYELDGAHAKYCNIGKLDAALKEFDRPPVPDDNASVCYRKGRLTEADYAEAIEDLQLAQAQAGDSLSGTGSVSCAICTAGDHTAETCHHNPLVLARRWAAATRVTSCYHCGYIAYTDEEALAHFGRHDDEVAKCLGDEAEGQIRAKLAKLTFNFYTRRLGELMHQAEHWAMPEHEYPLAVHHRVMAADECFQAIVAFDPDRHHSHGEVFANMEAALVRDPINQPGAYPPSPELHLYRGPRYVVTRLDDLKKGGADRG